MENLAVVFGSIFGAAFVAKLCWLTYMAVFKKENIPTETFGSVSGWSDD